MVVHLQAKRQVRIIFCANQTFLSINLGHSFQQWAHLNSTDCKRCEDNVMSNISIRNCVRRPCYQTLNTAFIISRQARTRNYGGFQSRLCHSVRLWIESCRDGNLLLLPHNFSVRKAIKTELRLCSPALTFCCKHSISLWYNYNWPLSLILSATLFLSSYCSNLLATVSRLLKVNKFSDKETWMSDKVKSVIGSY